MREIYLHPRRAVSPKYPDHLKEISYIPLIPEHPLPYSQAVTCWNRTNYAGLTRPCPGARALTRRKQPVAVGAARPRPARRGGRGRKRPGECAARAFGSGGWEGRLRGGPQPGRPVAAAGRGRLPAPVSGDALPQAETRRLPLRIGAQPPTGAPATGLPAGTPAQARLHRPPARRHRRPAGHQRQPLSPRRPSAPRPTATRMIEPTSTSRT